MTDLNSLAERCEKATGPDRELDGLIEVARDPMRETILYDEPGPFPQKPVYGPIKDLVLTGKDLADYIGAPTYTASIDAAMTLVPEGWHVSQLGEMRYIAGERPWCALLDNWQDTEMESGQRFRGQGTAPALALCAAALRARAGGE